MDESTLHPRVQAVVAAFNQVQASHIAQLKPLPLVPQFRTRQDGAVIDQIGAVIFTPPRPPVKGT